MGATASINYAASKKYKPCEPIEVKFNKVVKYDDGDEKPFKGWNNTINSMLSEIQCAVTATVFFQMTFNLLQRNSHSHFLQLQYEFWKEGPRTSYSLMPITYEMAMYQTTMPNR